MEYLVTGSALVSGSYTTILQAAADKKLLIKTIHLANITSSNAEVNLQWIDSSESNREYFLAKDVVIPNASSFQAIDGTFVLDNNDSLRAFTNLTESIDASVSFMEISNSEG
tara:strand:- start:105 stop:440 length:336 start_codon:yes stop_codon:yes gene_type:complete